MKLSSAQARALAKLTAEWQSVYCLQESLSTLDALAAKGMAERRQGPGYIWSPRTSIMFRRKPQENNR